MQDLALRDYNEGLGIMESVKIFSSGGGVQSTAVLVLSAQRKINYPIHVFANVGDRAESAETIAYVRDILRPYAKTNGIQWADVCKKDKAGKAIDLLDKLEQSTKSVPIPVRMAGSGAPGNRGCTVEWKIKPVANFIKSLIPVDMVKKISKEIREMAPDIKRQADFLAKSTMSMDDEAEYSKSYAIAIKNIKFKAQSDMYSRYYPIILGKGISTDEAQRAKKETGFAHYQAEYPLIALGLSRMDCIKIIEDAGLPPAPKSACWFCPYKTKAKWQDLRSSDLERFEAAVTLEKLLHSRSVALGRGGCFFTSTGTSKNLFLDEITSPNHQYDLFHGFDDGECESGYCWT